MRNLRSLKILISLFMVYLLLNNGSLLSQEAPDSSDIYLKHQSTKKLRELFKPKESWEKVVSFPGMALYFPLRVMFQGVKGTIIWFDSESAAWLRELLTPRITVRGILPAYSGRSGIGITYFDNNFTANQSSLTITGKMGYDNRSKVQVDIRKFPLLVPRLHSDVRLMYRLMTIETFYGIGPDTKPSSETSFSHEISQAEIQVGSYLNKKTVVHVNAGIEQNNILGGKDDDVPSTTEIFTAETLPGMQTRLKFWSAGFSVVRQSFEDVRMNLKGSVFNISWTYYDQIQGDQFRFWKLVSHYGYYFNLFYSRDLFLRFGGQMTEAVGNKQIPFFHLGELGRQETIRGFERGRFRDKDMIFGSVELTYPVWKVFHAVFFLDAGQVNPRILRDFTFRKLKLGYGGGLRVILPQMLLLRLEIGFTKEQFRVYLNLNT